MGMTMASYTRDNQAYKPGLGPTDRAVMHPLLRTPGVSPIRGIPYPDQGMPETPGTPTSRRYGSVQQAPCLGAARSNATGFTWSHDHSTMKQSSQLGGTDVISICMVAVQVIGIALTIAILRLYTPLPSWMCFPLGFPLFFGLFWAGLWAGLRVADARRKRRNR